MRKSLSIIVLALLQVACATSGAGSESGQSLLTFQQISEEILIQRESLQSDPDLSRATARNGLTTN